MLRLLSLVVVCGATLVACSGELAKDATAAVVGKGIEVSKGAVTGIASGIEQGRKQGESADGALIVSTSAELSAHGGAKLGTVEASGEGSAITILIENTTDKPMRLTRAEVIVLDKEGVVAESHLANQQDLTVPPRAKAKLVATAALAADKVGVVRLNGQDLDR
jgi:hypothetical protein